ncbi:MAG TPA: D-alanyl-D-alanine carboxypeptidase/D-alanyl-D-alanine-endopeptidase [Solirubrobacterales bacterium]|jgi:D-alanyl-D-alanine carboxypeptidase/D-alanyl-D-alanine-endopeptidase (penicillin-binding protein 4)
MRRGSIALASACAALILLALLAGAAEAASSCALMKRYLAQGTGGGGGLLVVDAESGDVVCSSAASTPRPLASNMKLFTTSTALAKLGPETRIPTKVFASGTVDSSGVLDGNLYLQGGGDPTLGTPGFYDSYLAGLGTNIFALTPQIKAAGITAVTGRLYADASVFDSLKGVKDSGYATSPYIGPLSGLAFNSGFAGQTSSSGFSASPAKLAATKLDRNLRAEGVNVPTQIALGVTPASAKRVAIVESPTLTRIVNTTDVYSDNFFAEMLIKLLGARFGGAGTTAAGAAVVSAFARSLGSGVHAVDGSGLTRTNTASPQQVVDLLLGMRTQPVYEQFLEDLAVAGKEGTVDERMRGTPAYGNCHLKTGTLTGVSNLSGYCFNPSGRVMIFSILMGSVPSTTQAHIDQDRIAGLVAAY